MNRWRAEAGLIFNTLIWGCTFVVVKEALNEVSTVLFLALRFTVATAALVVMLRRQWSGAVRPGPSWRAGIIAGCLLFGGYLFQTLGLRLTTPPKSAFLTGLCTVMVPLLGMCVYRIRPRLMELVGVAVATAGMGLMTLGGSGNAGPLGGINRGDLLTIVCALAYAAHILALSHFASKVSFGLLAVAQIGTAAVLSWALCWWVEAPYIHWRPSVVWAILVTGLLATALAFTIQTWAMRHTTSTRTALIFTLEPVFAWITSYVFVGESLSGRAAAGAALILIGVLAVELKPFQAGQHPSR